MVISEKELGELRKVHLLAMPDTATIIRPVEVDDGSLGTTTKYQKVASTPCRVDELGEGRDNSEVEVGGAIASVGAHLVRLPFGTEIDEQDQLEVVTSGRTRLFEVSRIYEATYATALTVGCTEVRRG